MNTETKRHIDAARQVLVGVVPNPTSQIDQITNALIYKFMDDMDQASIKSGGEPSFFVGDLEKYAWTRLMDTKIGNQDRMNLYVEALSKFSESANLPELFRNIFRSAFLPYRSPEVLGLFLKEINYFDYSHPEELGNAYEYLLSIMSSQGDAGQFRTPRHIIDFIVDVVNPTKDEKVLDPACGTGGFLVSAYRRILEQHDGKNDPSKKEKPLTPDDRKNIMNNFEGYDIDPGMVRIAQVNMYLHQFKNPKIYQYDTLSMDERWNDKFDVILANPPFMSPKGGIKPHSKFSMQSTRSEVLFVDYIKNHLRPNGRAGIIVPEGIIFQSGTAYKQLRKALVEDGLYAVVSLPSGVFQPYSGVKTSILLFDNQIAKLRDSILFVKVENDGYTLGATRTKFDKNDLPKAKAILAYYRESGQVLTEKVSNAVTYFEGHEIPKITWSDIAQLVEKKKIDEDGDYNLSGDRYRVKNDIDSSYTVVDLSELCEIRTGRKDVNEGNPNGEYPFFTCAKDNTYIDSYTFDTEALLIAGNGDVGAVKYYKGKFDAYQRTYVLTDFKGVDAKYLYYVLDAKLKSQLQLEKLGNTMPYIKLGMLQKFKVPLPAVYIQEQIVAELDGYQKIIDGAKQVVENWKPRIEIDPSWKNTKLGDICEIGSSKRVYESEWKNEGIPFYRAREIVRLSKEGSIANELFISNEMFEQYALKYGIPEPGDIMVTGVGTLGVCYQVKENDKFYFKDGNIIWLKKFRNTVLPEFILYLFETDFIKDQIKSTSIGGTVGTYTIVNAKKTIIPLPAIEVQRKIVETVRKEKLLIGELKYLIAQYYTYQSDVINKLWINN